MQFLHRPASFWDYPFVPFDSFPRLPVCLFVAWACFYAPGLALTGRRASSLPAPFVRVAWSAIVSTLTATLLAAAGRFSLPAVLAANALVCVAALPLRRLLAAGAPEQASPPRDFVGPLVFALALAACWPGYPGFLGASDSTAYVTTGVSLAHHGTLYREDRLLTEVPPLLRPIIFDSMSQVFGSTGPPYRRAPGAMLVEDLSATKAWPDFFPVPSVWSAMFVQAGATGGEAREMAAPNYAPFFAALALWAYWLLASRWLGTGYALAAVALLGASAPWLMGARLALSEPIAAFFALSALAMLAAGGPGLGRADALLAGAALGAAVFTRIETALLVLMALALQPSLERRFALNPAPGLGPWRTSPAFLGSFAVVAVLTVIPATTVPGTWTLPLLDHVSNAWIGFILKYGLPSPGEFVVGAGVATTLLALALRHFGLSATLRWAFLCSIVAGHAAASNWLAERTPMWLSFSIGWQGMALAAAGAVLAWRSPSRPAGASFLLALLAAVTAILFYNPHVYPALPWGARRFVPLLLPLGILLGCLVAARAHSRSRVLGFGLLALLAWPVVTGGRPLWGRLLVEGAWESLAELDRAIPRDGTIFVDREVSSMMVAPSLWLVHDRENITVPPTGGRAGKQYDSGLVWHFTEKGPVYFVTRGAGTQTPPPFVRMTLLSRIPLTLPLLEQAYNRRPEKIQRFMMPLAVYRMERYLGIQGTVVQR